MIILKSIIFHPHNVRCIQSFTRNINPLTKEMNECRVIGTVVDVFQLYRNTLTLLLKTYDDNQFYEIHKVSVPQSLVEKASSIALGQKLYVFGRLRPKRFKRNDGNVGSEFNIKAHQIYVCDSDDKSKPCTNDITNRKANIAPLNSHLNEAQIFGQISFEVVNKVKFSVFYLASNYFSLPEQGNVQHVDFIPIYVYDEALREYVRNHLKRLDRVRIEGILKNIPKSNDTGKTQMMGYIKAHSIRKMLSMHAIDDQINTIKDRKLF